MNICVNEIGADLESIIVDYNSLSEQLHLESDDDTKYKFSSHNDFISTLISCKRLIVGTLRLYTYMNEGEAAPIFYPRTRDLYKRSQIRVTYNIIYHDLKNVFEIIDIADSEKCNTLSLDNVTEDDLENIYVAMISFIQQTIKLFYKTFSIGGTGKNGTRKRRAASKEV